jgi:MFS family permease
VSSDSPQSAESLRTLQPPVRWYHPLTQQNYRLYLGMTFTGSMGVWMQRLAQDWLVLQLTGSPAAVGIAVALQFLPMLVVGPLSGLLVDMFPKRSLMILCQSVIVILAIGLAAWDASGGITVWVVYGSCIALGITSAIDGPARQVFLNEVVGDAGLRSAIGLNNAIGQLGAVAGPALGGVVIAYAGSAAAFASNAFWGCWCLA